MEYISTATMGQGYNRMVNASDYLNKRYSTRNLSDIEFENILPDLAEEISKTSFYVSYSDDVLNKDYAQLCKWKSNENFINSTSRLGMKLCEHFFPNFYDIETNTGNSFRGLWNKDNLIKILRWNRKSHSTPYLSELKRGIYFNCGLPKSTMYRPQMMKLACMKYNAETVLDPCAGWGGRMLGAVSAGCKYYAFEPNTTTYDNLQKLINFLGIQNRVQIICDDARNMNNYNLPNVDLVLTSPPYFDLEVYTHEDTQSITNCDNYDNWCETFLKPIIEKSLAHLMAKGVSCWNVGKVGNRDMFKDVIKYHNLNNYTVVETLSVYSSKRQVNQSVQKNAKSSDDTMIFRK